MVKALDGSYRNQSNQLVNQIKKDSAVMVFDNKWLPSPDTSLDLTGVYRIKNIISLKLNEDSNILFKPKFTVTLKVKLYITKSNYAIDSSLIQTLSITYDSTTYNSQNVFTFYNAYKVQVKILSVDSTYSYTTTPKPAVTPFVRLENEMQITREYNFTCNAASASSIEMDATAFASTGEITTRWQPIQGAVEYDLEWSYIDNESLLDPELYKTSGVLDPKKIFTDNATRITVTSTSYKIPVLYDEAGTLFARYRPVQNKPNGQRYEGNWSSDNSSGLGQYITATGHEPALNWQATTSFAEEGKRKSVVQYYDGSLRSRQTVTKDNSTNTTVVAETLYDFQGRPVIQVLPSPTLSSLIQYSKNFNRGINATPYDKNLYDTLINKSDYCLSPAPAMATDSGAAKYYSPNNPLVNSDYHKFIPNANGYAFTETRYTQDNSGRVLAQSGVGDTYKIGSGHETKYFYGNPSQTELDGLFGTEVGYAAHYVKNMVRDANGQYSVSYIDMHGRTVATALAGKAPAALDTIASYKKINVTERLSDSANNIIKDIVMESSRSILVTDSATYTFNYSLNPDSIRLQTCNNTNICYDCLYNLEITITDECNNCHLPYQQPYVALVSNFSFANIDTLCDTPAVLSKSFPIELAEGNYTITKKLSVSRYAFDYYRDSVFMKKNTCKTFQDFYKQQIDSIKSGLNCNEESCDSCSQRTASLAAFRVYYLTTIGIPLADSVGYRDDIAQAFDIAKEQCNFICANVGEHDFVRKAMLMDMTVPLGQYANPDSANLADSYGNILNDNNSLWRSVVYYDEYGKPDSIINNVGELVIPTHASISKEEFILKFKNEWANDLLPLHPEYEKLVEYEKHRTSHLWDEKFGSSDTYTDADSKGYLNPVGLSGAQVPSHFINLTAGLDPLAKPDSLLNGIMQTAVYAYKTENATTISLWGIASVSGKCPNNNTCALNYTNSNLNNCINPSSFCTGELDMSWRSFRQIYLTEKRRNLMSKLDEQFPSIHVNIPPSRLEHFAQSSASLDAYIQSVQGQGGSTVLAGANSQMQQFYKDNCENYAASWWTNLAPCNLTYTDSVRLIPRMVQICSAGSDVAHPFGSSSTAPGSTFQYKSFEVLIKHYIDSMHVINPGQYNYDIACNADAIYIPMDYDKQQALSVIPIWTKPDSCQCSRITTLYNEFRKFGAIDTSFAAYVLRQTGTQMSDADLRKLRALCEGSDTCKFLVTPINLPPALQCGITDVCITCTQVQNVFDSFKVVYKGALPAFDESDSVQVLKNRAFANYMNKHLGFTKQAADYLEFMTNCSISYSINNAGCDSLKQLLSNFQKNIFNQQSPQYDIGGCDTSHIKLSVLNSTYHSPAVKLSDWMYNGVFKTPWNDSIHLYPNFIYKDTVCINQKFTFEARIRSPHSPINQAKYINAGGSMYFSSFYGTDVNYVYFDNYTKLVGFHLIRGVGHPALNRDSIFMTIEQVENGIVAPEKTLKSTGLKNLSNWVNVSLKVDNNKVYFYSNTTLIDSVIFSTPIQRFNMFIAEPYGFDFQIDALKMFDENNELRYFEDFNGCGNQSKQTMPRCQPDCSTGFVSYFNTLKATNLNFSQIDSLYFNNCGIHPNPCTDDPKNCSLLKQAIADWYTSLYGVNYDSNGLRKNLWGFGGNYSVKNVANLNLKDFIKNGILSTPDSVTVQPGDFCFGYSIPMCVSNGYTFSTRMRGKPGYDYSLLQFLNVLVHNNSDRLLTDLTTNSGYNGFFGIYNDANNVSHSFADWTQAATMQTVFSDWKVFKIVFKDNRAWEYIDDTLRGSIYYPTSMYQVNFNMCGWGNSPIDYDWVKIYDASNNLKYQEDFSDYTNLTIPPYDLICPNIDCASTFPGFFNSRFKTSLTYQQISKIYQQSCGISMQPCGLNESLLCGKTEPLFPPVFFAETNPCEDSSSLAFVKATELYKNYQDSLKNAFDNAYLKKCMQAFKTESFTVTHPQREYHYTLYYYDQAGNLVKTVPPAGVDLTNYNNATWLANVATARKNSTVPLVPAHGLQTNYRYNTLNQVMAQTTPDAGLSNFWYDRLGRLIISQNAKQKAVSATENNRNYSYTKYDALGRITEVAQLKNATTTALTQAVAQDTTAYKNWFTAATASGVNIEMVTRTVYDNKYGSGIGLPILYPKNLRNRVAYTTYTDGNSIANYNTGTFYSYDIHGNVDTLLQDYGQSGGVANIMNSNIPPSGSNRWKRLVYKYDLISGKVNHVAYQPNYFDGTAMVISQDAIYHRYTYDAENRLTIAETSTDSTVWQKDARYTYYKHGPLARTIIGQRQVQGIDYAYTLQGWLKGVNSTALSSTLDMGRDGDATNAPTAKIAKDAYSFNLNYYLGDYGAINSSNVFAGIGTVPAPDLRNLYNGNITSMAVNIGKFNSTAGAAGDSALLYNYKYDQLNRIVSMDAFRGLNTTTNTWNNSLTKLTQYKERISYDANGNILKFLRNGNITTRPLMDSLSYKYNTGNNQLNWVRDSVAAVAYTDDIDNNQSANNYLYDAIGNLVRDSSENIRLSVGGIKWNVYGKIAEINKVDSNAANPYNKGRIKRITYTYDAAGNRISKKVEKYPSSYTTDYTWYVRDASGNVMSTYTYSVVGTSLTTGNLIQNEVYLYGSSRLGSLTVNRNVEVTKQTTDTTYTMPSGITGGLKVPFVTGLKQYELSNHLGNVLVTVSDKKIGHDAGGGIIDYYTADVITANDFYSFGMVEPGRKFVKGSSKYRYSINGQEKETELNENITTAEYWEYDSRIGRRLNVEPEIKKYQGFSGYLTFRNNPILYSDTDGKDVILLTWATKGGDVGHTVIAIQQYKTIKGKPTPIDSYNLYEIGPANMLYPSQIATSVTADSRAHRGFTKAQLLANKDADGKNISHWDNNAPDGAILFKSGAKSDTKATATMDEKNWSDRLYYRAVGGDGKTTDNCTSYVIEIIPKDKNETLDASETVILPEGKKIVSINPTQLFKAATKLKEATILKDIPKDLKDKSFIDAYYTKEKLNTNNGNSKKKL
jgi:hypothetical protein